MLRFKVFSPLGAVSPRSPQAPYQSQANRRLQIRRWVSLDLRDDWEFCDTASASVADSRTAVTLRRWSALETIKPGLIDGVDRIQSQSHAAAENEAPGPSHWRPKAAKTFNRQRLWVKSIAFQPGGETKSPDPFSFLTKPSGMTRANCFVIQTCCARNTSDVWHHQRRPPVNGH